MEILSPLVLCGESEEDLRVMRGSFVEVGKEIYLKVNANKSNVMVLGEEEGSVNEVIVNARPLERVSEFK